MFIKKSKLAFTLIELLVVIAVIGVIAAIAIVDLQHARRNARDLQRTSDIIKIQTALEMYYNDNYSYPESIEGQIADAYTVHMEAVPTAPDLFDGDCDSESNNYIYFSDGKSYTLAFCLGGETGGFAPGNNCVTPLGKVEGDCPFICGAVFTDDRDQSKYDTVKIGNQCWMTRNLNIGNRIDVCQIGSCSGSNCLITCEERDSVPKNQEDPQVIEKYCWYDNEDNCDIYGGLYQWPQAMNYETSEGAQGICPEDWRIPTDEDRKILEGNVDSVYGVGHTEWNKINFRGSDTGIKLKDESWSGTNDFNFSALKTGTVSTGNRFYSLDRPMMWTSTIDESEEIWQIRFISWHSTTGRTKTDNELLGRSIRCLRD